MSRVELYQLMLCWTCSDLQQEQHQPCPAVSSGIESILEELQARRFAPCLVALVALRSHIQQARTSNSL